MSEKNKALINQIIRFGLVGISNTIVSYVIYAVAFALTDNYFLANVLSWLLSVLHSSDLARLHLAECICI